MHVKELHLLSDDLVSTEEFYNNKLDINTYDKNKTSISFNIGKTKVVFHKSENIKPIYHYAIDIPSNQLDESLAWAEKRFNLLPISEHIKVSVLEHWKAKSIYFYDNNGNLLEFISRSDLNNNSFNSFSSASFLYLSEIGIVTDNVPQKVDSLMKEYNLPVFLQIFLHNHFG